MGSGATRLLTVPEVAHALHVSRASIYRRIEDGQLQAQRVGANGPLRIEPEAVKRLLLPARRRQP